MSTAIRKRQRPTKRSASDSVEATEWITRRLRCTAIANSIAVGRKNHYGNGFGRGAGVAALFS